MADRLSALEAAWRHWLALGARDRRAFLLRFREHHKLAMEARVAANRRAAGEPAPRSAFDEMAVAALDFEARPW